MNIFSSILSDIQNILLDKKDELNNINVFPIADRDTGNNLYETFTVDIHANNLKDFIVELSNNIMYSARGSSGNIVALYILGMNNYYNDSLSSMCKSAADFTWSTMYEPKEGTILTAMKAVPESYDSVADFLLKYQQNAIKCLLSGPSLLPILKKNNTLDSGTLGFIYILSSIYQTITGVNIVPDIQVTYNQSVINQDDYAYCVELLLAGTPDLKELQQCGNELIVLRQNNTTKVHIHTNDYAFVISSIKKGFDIRYLKIDDMKNGTRQVLQTKETQK